MAAVSEIMQEVLKLPRSERSFLARKLLESLESDESFSAHETKLFQSRSREIREGLVKPLTLEQLQQEIEDYEDLKTLRDEKTSAHSEPTRSLDSVLKQIDH